jgi:hypothetical protein
MFRCLGKGNLLTAAVSGTAVVWSSTLRPIHIDSAKFAPNFWFYFKQVKLSAICLWCVSDCAQTQLSAIQLNLISQTSTFINYMKIGRHIKISAKTVKQ